MREITVLIDDEQTERAESTDEKARGEGQGVGGPRQGLGPTAKCVCPKCGKEYEHTPDVPCAEMKCEKCGVALVGEETSATEAESQTTIEQMRDALVSAIDGALSRLVKGKKGAESKSELETEPESVIEESEKAGRRVRADRVSSLQKLQKELEDFLGAFKEFLGWAAYDDENPKSPLDLWTGDGKKALAMLNEHGTAACAFKARDGQTWWLQFTSNAFLDREGETFTTKALEDYVARHSSDAKKGEFWYRHIPGTKFGDVRWQAMVGRFLAQAGPFDDTFVGSAFKEFFSEYPHGHESIAPTGWGASHKYRYDSKDREDKVYESLEIVESTVLPRSIAANPYNPTPFVITDGGIEMNTQEKKDLLEIGGEKGQELLDYVLNLGEKATVDLEAAGIAHKQVDEDQVDEDEVESKSESEDEKAAGSFASRIEKILAKVKDVGHKSRLEKFVAKLKKESPYPKPKAKKPEDEEEETKAASLAKLGQELRMLAGLIGGDAGTELRKIADEMAGGKSGEEYPRPKAKKEIDPLTREEVASALGGIVSALREETKATITETVAEAVAPLVEAIKALAVDDAQKVAQKAAETPAASLSALLESVIGSSLTKVKEGSPLAESGPKETPPDSAAITGIPFVDGFIVGTDQK